MATEKNSGKKINWSKIVDDVLSIRDLDDLKKEVTEIRAELKNFDVKAHLTPGAQMRIKQLEKKYDNMLKSLHKAQRQFDREFNKALRSLKRSKTDAAKKAKDVKAAVKQQQLKIEKVLSKSKKKKSSGKKRKKATTVKKKSAKKTTAKKTTKKTTSN